MNQKLHVIQKQIKLLRLSFFRNPSIVFLIISIIGLSIIPFFWMKPDQMDLGGDSSRLYFYNPLLYIQHMGLYTVFPEGFGHLEPNYYFLPYSLFLAGLKIFFQTPYALITIINILKLTGGFLAVYLIVREILLFHWKDLTLGSRKLSIEFASIMAGIFYILMPKMIWNYDKALTSHNQVFLNPLCFYLLLKATISNDKRYLWFFLLITVIFAPNFAFTSAPPFFAFYPLSIFFIFLYVSLIRKQHIPFKTIGVGIIVFFLLQGYQLIPQISSLFDPGSFTNTRVFNPQSIYQEGVNYFYGVLPIAKTSLNIFLPVPLSQVSGFTLFAPVILLLGFLLQKSKVYILTTFFFLITFYLLTAHITDLGVSFYANLFYLPGFSMFRNFIGQWAFVFAFFYALLFGQALSALFIAVKKKQYIYIISGIILTCLIITAYPFINGSMVNKLMWPNSDMHIAFQMDPNYESTAQFMKNLPDDGKILTLPFSDPYYQVLAGTNNGVYIGPSINAFLTQKKDFTGYQVISPFSDVFLRLIQEKKYSDIQRLLGLLNIHYIYFNSDPRVYDNTYVHVPYDYVRQFLPRNSAEYSIFMEHIGAKKIFQKSHYSVYVLSTGYLPHIYTSNQASCYTDNQNDWYGKNESFFSGSNLDDARLIYLYKNFCHQFPTNSGSLPNITFTKINPTRYTIHVTNANNPYWLVFSDSFHTGWRLYATKQTNDTNHIANYFSGTVTETKHENIFIPKDILATWNIHSLSSPHTLVNGYANGWYVAPNDVSHKTEYTLILELTTQRIFYIFLLISLISFIGFLLWGIYLFKKKKTLL